MQAPLASGTALWKGHPSPSLLTSARARHFFYLLAEKATSCSTALPPLPTWRFLWQVRKLCCLLVYSSRVEFMRVELWKSLSEPGVFLKGCGEEGMTVESRDDIPVWKFLHLWQSPRNQRTDHPPVLATDVPGGPVRDKDACPVFKCPRCRLWKTNLWT